MLYFLILMIVAIGVMAWHFNNGYKSSLSRQCAYGDLTAFKLLKKPNDYLAFKKLFATLTKPSERYFYSLSASRGLPLKTIEKWLRNEPESADAQLCYGAALIQWAWEARGYGGGSTVSDEAWHKYHQRLNSAKDVLLQSIQVNSLDPTPWAYLIIVATGNSEDDETKNYYFQQAVQLDPENWAAHMHMMIALSKKWGGSHEKMLSFARYTTKNASQGSDIGAILVKAFIEYWKYLDLFEEDEAGAKEFIKDPKIQYELIEAYEKSLAHNEHEPCLTTIFARYNLSGWFWLTNDRTRLRYELDILGDTIEDVHWRWVGTEGTLQNARNFAMMEK